MKTTIFTITCLLMSNLIWGQMNGTDERRYISVTGSAEVIVSPDEIELEIVLKEYTLKNNKKVELQAIESKFDAALEANNIDKQNVMLGNSDYYWYYWWSYRSDQLKRKKYNVKLNSSTNFLSLVQDLDFEGIHTLRISNKSNKELQKLRKDIKIAALQAAKEKATYLLESIDEKLGKVISIEEVPDNRNYYRRGSQNMLSNTILSTNSSEDDIENVATIKLRYEVKAKFEIE